MENSIHDRRKALGFSQQELAKRCGVSRQTINAIENNKYDPTLALCLRSRARASDQPSMSFSLHNDEQPRKIGAAFYLRRTGIRISVMLSAMDFATASLSPVS